MGAGAVKILLPEVRIEEYDALAIPGGFEEFGFYEFFTKLGLTKFR